MKKYIILLLTIVAIGCNSKSNERKENKNTSAEKTTKKTYNESEIHLTEEQLVSAKIVIKSIEKKNIRERINVTGIVSVPPQSKATVYAPMESFLYKTDLLPGDKVRKGQIVAVLQHSNFTKLQYSYLESINKRNVCKADYERKKMLFENDIASKKSFQAAEGLFHSSQSLVDSYASQLKMAGLSPYLITSKGIQQFVYIKSPIDGYIAHNNLSKGKFLSANQEMLEIINNNHLHAELNIFGADILRIKKGDTFLFRPSGTDTLYKGYIKLISQTVDEETKTANIHGHFEDKEQNLKSGMFIIAHILIGGKEVFAVPEESIIENEGENFVFMAENRNEFIPLKVTLGNTDNGFTEIKTIQNNNFNIKIVSRGTHFLKGVLLQKEGGMEGHAH